MNFAKPRGLWVDVFRPADGSDCTNGGPTSKLTRVFLLGIPDGQELPTNIRDVEIFKLVRRQVGTGYGAAYYYHVEPLIEANGNRMAGGNFVYTLDSRLRSICAYPISVHDREEWAEVTAIAPAKAG